MENKNKPSTPVAVPPTRNDVVTGMPIIIAADRLHYPVKLQGQLGSVILDDGEAATIFGTFVLLAKSAGWTGGNALVDVIKGNLVNRRLENGMTISKTEAAQFVEIVVSRSNGDPLNQPVIGNILRLFKCGNVTIYTD